MSGNVVDASVHTVKDIVVRRREHNDFSTIRISAYDKDGQIIHEATYFSENGELIKMEKRND